GRQLLVASGYGFGSIAPAPPDRQGRSYVDRVGVISILDIPGERELEKLTEQVLSNNRSGRGRFDRAGEGGNEGRDDDEGGEANDQPIPMHRGQRSPIKHVFYIIKENRTYDQVFGALPRGNGDPSLVEFGADVAPNHQALAEQFVLLDNYYGPGDQS